MLLEALIGVVIFALGILALIGLQSTAIKDANEAKYRSDASFLTNRVIGDLWLADKTALAGFAGTYSATSNAGSAWADAATDPLTGLPNGSIDVVVNVINDATGEVRNEVVVTVTWQAPGSTPHNFTQRAVIVDA